MIFSYLVKLSNTYHVPWQIWQKQISFANILPSFSKVASYLANLPVHIALQYNSWLPAKFQGKVQTLSSLILLVLSLTFLMS